QSGGVFLRSVGTRNTTHVALSGAAGNIVLAADRRENLVRIRIVRRPLNLVETEIHGVMAGIAPVGDDGGRQEGRTTIPAHTNLNIIFSKTLCSLFRMRI